VNSPVVPQKLGENFDVAPRRRASYHAVVFFGIATDLHERVASTVGAAEEIGVLGRAAVVSGDDLLGHDGGQVVTTMTKVDDLFGLLVDPRL
jgi:hypothetical protein